LNVAIDIILPVFGLVLIGYLSGRFRWIADAGIEGLASFVFSIAIPVMLFRSIAIVDLPSEIPWGYVLAYYTASLGLFGICLIGGRLIQMNAIESSIFAMSSVYSNIVLLGIPLVLASLGDAATVPLFIIVSTHAAIMFFITTFFAESGKGNVEKLYHLPMQTLKVLLKNPIFVGIVLGVMTNLASIELPAALDKTAAYLGKAALPCAVFSIGATISRYKISGDILKIAITIAVKNLIHPILVWVACTQIFGLEPMWVAVAVILASCPSGINVYLFANRYQVIVPSTATIVVLSTVVSVPVISLVLVLLVV